MGTRSYFGLVAVVAAVAMTMACNSPRRGGGGGGGGGEDAGGGTMTDGGGGDTDSGGIVLMDSGMTGTDSGATPECTTSSDCGVDEECIEGSCETTTMSCATNTVSLYGGVACSSSTLDCISECGGDGMCQQGCLDADPNEDCSLCFSQNLVSCFNRNGCQGDWNCYTQCVSDNCPSGDETCIDSMCGTQWDTYVACTEGVTADCSPDALMCFPAS